ncbi:MAG: filamentous hemagglutinin N-terminal domain-containing protein, partial [Cyanobacteria bacterium J06600_6]
MAIKQVSLVSSVIVSFYCLMAINSAQAQIIPDSTTDADVIDSCANSCNITGGKLAGENLFHSFQEFSIRQGESVYFADPGVANIFSRVTGNNASQIFGTLGVSGNATLFLLNPNGIIFGEGATLDINGSFFATTADEIQFGDLGSFAAVSDSSENLTLLTVNPNALLFNQMGQQGAIAKLAEGIAINNTSLNLPETETLTLLG